MRRRVLMGGIVGGVMALSVGCSPEGAPGGEGPPSPKPSQVLMPTENADHYDVVVPEGWKVGQWDQYRVATFWAYKVEDVEPRAQFGVEGWSGRAARLKFTLEPPGVDAVSWEEVRDTQWEYFSGSRFHDLVLLPDRSIGGERAAGMRVNRVGKKNTFVWEQWHVLRHDGVWLFDLLSGGGRDRIGDDVYEFLDSFRWTGPAPSPIPEPLPVPTPRQR